jgi:hypothetical protein
MSIFFFFEKYQKPLQYLSLSQINIWRSNGLSLCKTAMLFTLRERCSKQRERNFCYCWNLFVCNIAIAFFFLFFFFFIFFNFPFKFFGAVLNRIVNNMFVFILCASVFLIWFSILIFALIIFFFFCWKSSFFYPIYKNDGRIKKYLSDRSFFLYLQILWNWKKYRKK